MGGFDLMALYAVSTAIAHSESLRESSLGMDTEIDYDNEGEAGDFEWWSWLAYALFSREASYAIHAAKLNMLALNDMEYADGMRAVLSHADPLAYLYYEARVNDDDLDTPASVESTASRVVLTQSARLHLGHYGAETVDGSPAEVPVLAEPGVAYQVVRNRPEDDTIDILVPAYGVCWTTRTEVVEWKPMALREIHSIRHLTLESMEEEAIDGVIQLMELVGGPLSG